MMGLQNRAPAVCSVLRGKRLQEEAGLTFEGQDGPANGMNVWFKYAIGADGASPVSRPKQSPVVRLAASPPAARPNVAYDGALVLVSCTKAKLRRPARASDLYCSPGFRMKKAIVANAGADWLILSAKHGVVRPDDVIEPYDETLTNAGVAHRKSWSRRVLGDLLPIAKGHGKVICFAGRSYTEFLTPALRDAGVEVLEPLRGLRQGEQLAWLTQQQ